jgi:hypothetical protein
VRGFLLAGLLVSAGLAVGGCSTSGGGVPQPAAAPLVLSSNLPPPPAPAPAVLVTASPQPAAPPTAYTDPGAVAAVPVAAAGAAPSSSELLSPNEKARVIAELEALARAQTPTATPPGAVPPCTVDPAVLAALPQPLTPEQAATLCAAPSP